MERRKDMRSNKRRKRRGKRGWLREGKERDRRGLRTSIACSLIIVIGLFMVASGEEGGGRVVSANSGGGFDFDSLYESVLLRSTNLFHDGRLMLKEGLELKLHCWWRKCHFISSGGPGGFMRVLWNSMIDPNFETLPSGAAMISIGLSNLTK